jgi:hypothetical protein
VVDAADLSALVNGFDYNLSGWSYGDFNQDGVINADDFSLFLYGLAEYNDGTPIYVPEPAAVSLLAVAGIGIIARRRRVK